MPRVPVPVVSEHEVRDLSEDILRVTSLQVEPVSGGRSVLVLSAGVYWHGRDDGRMIDFALSPRAAAQLAGALQETVAQHLHASSEEKKGKEES